MSAYKKDETSLGFLMSEFHSKLGVGLRKEEPNPVASSWTVRAVVPGRLLDNQIRATLPFPTEVTVRTGPPTHMPPPSNTKRPDQTVRTASTIIDAEETGVVTRPRRRSPDMLPVPFGLGAAPEDLIRTKVARAPPLDGEDYVEDGATDRYVPLPSRPDGGLLDDEGPTDPVQQRASPCAVPNTDPTPPEPELPADDGLVLEYYQGMECAEKVGKRSLPTDPLPPIAYKSRRQRSVFNVLFSIGLGVAVGLSLALVGAAFLLIVYH